MADVNPTWQGLSDFDFQVALDTLEAMEALEARDEIPTPDAVRRELDPPGDDPTVTLPRIAQGIAQVGRWREQATTQAILQQRRELNALQWRLYGTALVCHRLQGCLKTLISDLDRILKSTPPT